MSMKKYRKGGNKPMRVPDPSFVKVQRGGKRM